jgi:hypothetical protein
MAVNRLNGPPGKYVNLKEPAIDSITASDGAAQNQENSAARAARRSNRRTAAWPTPAVHTKRILLQTQNVLDCPDSRT